jgi:hypothetical protein
MTFTSYLLPDNRCIKPTAAAVVAVAVAVAAASGGVFVTGACESRV